MKFIDSNVFVYFADGRNPKKQAIARTVLADAIGNRQYVISSQVLNEFAPDIRVLVTWDGLVEEKNLNELLPEGFRSDSMKKR